MFPGGHEPERNINKTIMKTLKSFIYIVFLAVGFSLSGCTKDSSTPVTGTRDAFLGKWSVSETWTKLAYEVTISADPNSSGGVFIYNFANTGSSSMPAGAAIDGTSIILDANQVIGDGITINGSGNLSGTRITWNYTLNNGADLINAIAVYTKQ
jgi:hypothetical protein